MTEDLWLMSRKDIHIRIPDEYLKAMKRYAEDRNLTVSGLVKLWIESEVLPSIDIEAME